MNKGYKIINYSKFYYSNNKFYKYVRKPKEVFFLKKFLKKSFSISLN